MSDAPAPIRKPARKTGKVSDFVVKSENPNGTTTWVNPLTMEEITLHSETAPTPELLRQLAANGLVPERPTLEDYEDELPVGNAPALPALEDDEDTPLSRVLTRLRSIDSPEKRMEVKIYRIKQDGKESYCGSFTIEEYDEYGEELIRAHYGAGTYRVRIYGPSLNPVEGSNYGKFVRHTNLAVEIESSLIPLKSTVPGMSAPDGVAAFMPIIQQLTQQVAELRSGGGAASQNQFLEHIKLMKELGLIGSNQNGGGVAKQIADMEAMLGLRRTLRDESDADNGGGGKTDSMLGLASEVLSMIKPQIGAQQAPQLTGPAEMAPSLDIPATFQPGAETAQLPEGDDVNAAQNLYMTTMIAAMCKSADRGESVDDTAKWLADKAPEEVIDMLEAPIWFDLLIESLPTLAVEITKRRDWFTKLRDAVLVDVYADDPEPAAAAAKPAPVARKTAKG